MKRVGWRLTEKGGLVKGSGGLFAPCGSRMALAGLTLLFALSSCVSSSLTAIPKPDTSPVPMTGKCLQGNCQEGEGTFKLDVGGKYVGKFSQGKFNEQGTITLADGDSFAGLFNYGRYQGGGPVVVGGKKGNCLKDSDCLNGAGMITFEDKTVYDGKFRLGKLEGYAVVTTPDGKTYKGTYVKGKLEGPGTITTSNDVSLMGSFKNGQLNGKVMIIYPFGTRFAGTFKDGEYDSDGVMTFPNGITGKCKEGNCIDGTGTLVLSDGSSYRGGFKECRKNGYGIFTSADGGIYKGEYKDGKRDGVGTYIFPSGIKYTGSYKDDERDGRGVYFFANGTSHTVYYDKGVLKSED